MYNEIRKERKEKLLYSFIQEGGNGPWHPLSSW
jgi:hypothetical protein